MNKRKLHHVLRILHKIHYTVLIVIFIIATIMVLPSLRSNNKQMILLREAVFTADKNNGDIEGALRTLRHYVFAHMNTNLSSGANAVKPPIQLKYHYERLEASAKASYEAANAAMINQAEATCIAQIPGTIFNSARIQCAKDYAAAHPVKQAKIYEDQYKFDFASPTWSPDRAGWSIVVSIVSMFLFITLYASELAIRRELAKRQ